MYLTYDEYQTYGGTLSQDEFIPLEFKARKRIDYLTDARVSKMATVPEAVKLCMWSIMQVIAAADAEAQVTNPTVTSYSTDGYSENYGYALSADSADKQIRRMIRSALYGELDDHGVPLLYRGVMR